MSSSSTPEVLTVEDANEAVAELVSIAESIEAPDRGKVLPETTPAMSETIRTIVALEIRGVGDREISDHLEKSSQYVSQLRGKFWKAFYQAKAEHCAQAFLEYGYNVQIFTAGLSQAAVLAVRTFRELMSDPDVHPRVRLDAAKATVAAASVRRKVAKDGDNDPLDDSVMATVRNTMEETQKILGPRNSVGNDPTPEN